MAGIAVLSFAYVLSQFYRSFLAVLTPVLSGELGMSVAQLSLASGAWFATFALAQFPVGIWLDKFGPARTASLLHGLFGAGGALVFATASEPVQIIVAMAMIGVGCSPVLMASFVIFARNYSLALFATLSSTFIAIGMIGSVLGAEPLAAAVDAWGWREVSWGLAAISFATSIGVYFAVNDPPKIESAHQGGFLEIFKIRQLWFLFPLIACSYAVPASVRGLWAGPYLEQVHGLDILGIGRVALYISFAQIVGTFIYGPMDRLFNTRKWVVVTGNCAMLASCIWLAINPAAPLMMVTAALMIMGFFGSASAVQTAHGKSFIPPHIIGRGMTLLNFFSIGGVALMQLASGVVVRNWASVSVPETGFRALFVFYTILLGSVIVIYLFSKDMKPR